LGRPRYGKKKPWPSFRGEKGGETKTESTCGAGPRSIQGKGKKILSAAIRSEGERWPSLIWAGGAKTGREEGKEKVKKFVGLGGAGREKEKKMTAKKERNTGGVKFLKGKKFRGRREIFC